MTKMPLHHATVSSVTQSFMIKKDCNTAKFIPPTNSIMETIPKYLQLRDQIN